LTVPFKQIAFARAIILMWQEGEMSGERMSIPSGGEAGHAQKKNRRRERRRLWKF